VTVTEPATPAVVEDGKPATVSVLTCAGLTLTFAWLPIMPAVVSLAEIDCVPAVFSVALKGCTPASAAVKV